jgi:HD-like signal output (HDOD) protein
LKLAVQSAQKFESSIKCEMLRDLIGRMETLPSAPTLFHKIVKELRDENTSLDDVGEIISSDIGMTAKLLKLVNSAFFGLKRQINNPAEAVTYLGLETIKALVLAVHAFDCFDGKDTGPLSLDKLWGHSLAVANWSRTIAREENSSASEIEETFTCGVLHDVGKLALSSNLPDLYRETLQLIAQQKFPLLEAEEKIFGANHADVGGYLLSLWGLPPRVVDPISFHHNPRQSAVGEMGPLAFVHAADAFVNEVDETADSGASIDEAYFAQYNFRENLSIWKGLQP